MKHGLLVNATFALLAAACAPEGRGETADNRADEAAQGVGEEVASPSDAAGSDTQALFGDWRLDGSFTTRLEGGDLTISDYSVSIHEDGTASFEGALVASMEGDTAAFRITGTYGWELEGETMTTDIVNVALEPETNDADLVEIASFIAEAIRMEPPLSYEVIELSERALRLRNDADGTVESYVR